MATTNKELLIFVPTFPVLSETFIQREIAELSKVATNYEVTVLSLNPGNSEVTSVPGIKVIYQRVSPLDIVKGFLTVNWITFSKLIAVSSQNKVRSGLANLYLLIKSIGYAHIIKGLEVSHIHAHFLSESSTLMYYVAQLINLPFSISAHARDVFATSDSVSEMPELVRAKAEKASFIVVCNKKAWEKCKELVGSDLEQKVILHYHGLDPSSLPHREAGFTPESPLKVVSVGRLVEKKGFKYLIDAAKILKDAGYTFHISIIGPGPLYETLSQQIGNLGVGDMVEILGGGKGMPNNEVLKHMSESDIFLLPSIETSVGDAEGVPNTLVEAAFLGLPIITTYSGSIAEFIVNNQSGVLVEPKNSQKLAEAIKTVADDPVNAVKMGYAASVSAFKTFDLTNNIKELDSLFSENLASN